MSIQFLPTVSNLAEAIEALQSNEHSSTCFGIEIETIDLSLLETESLPFPYFFWKSRSSNISYHAWGISECYASFNQVPQTAFPRFVCLPFSSPSKTNTWKNFPVQMIWKPCWCLEQGKKNILYHSPTLINREKQNTDHIPAPKENPNEENWIKNIIQSKQDFSTTSLEKIVLARQSRRSCSRPYQLFEELRRIQKNCYHFLFSPNRKEVFFGVSPERLLQIREGTLYTEALAGTRERSLDETRNNILSRDLFRSEKDQHEHGIVIQYIEDTLRSFCDDITIEKKQLLSLHHVQHLQTPIKATLSAAYSLENLIQALHPTPAVCGLPKQEAMNKIHCFENYDRGFYAGTMGIITKERIDLTVTIRSALWQDGQLLIWAGAGIVAQSNPKEEWMELNNKAKQFFERVDI